MWDMSWLIINEIFRSRSARSSSTVLFYDSDFRFSHRQDVSLQLPLLSFSAMSQIRHGSHDRYHFVDGQMTLLRTDFMPCIFQSPFHYQVEPTNRHRKDWPFCTYKLGSWPLAVVYVGDSPRRIYELLGMLVSDSCADMSEHWWGISRVNTKKPNSRQDDGLCICKFRIKLSRFRDSVM